MPCLAVGEGTIVSKVSSSTHRGLAWWGAWGLVVLLGMGAGAQAQAPAPGTPAAQGEQLFSGTVALSKGGPPCTMCHSAAQLGMAHKGTIGPDLSAVYAGLGREGLESMLSDHLPPTMTP